MFRHAGVLVAVLCCLSAPLVRGAISPRIIGGKKATNLHLPWMASISDNGKHFCGGSIVNERTILTAAHCLTGSAPSRLHVRVGSKFKSFGGELVSVASVKYHEKFMRSNMDYDIGVLRLSKDLVFSKDIQPITLAAVGETVPEDTDALISGWGFITDFGPSSSYLQYAMVKTINQATCNRWLSDEVTDRMLCAGVQSGGIDACQLDSGGPLVIGTKLVGIVSWGWSCALPEKPGVYARISALRYWVDNYLRQYNERLQ